MSSSWKLIREFLRLQSPWLTLIGEKWQDSHGKLLDYWRVEKSDSLIIVTQHQNQLIFPKRAFRTGVQHTTLDFAGGRVDRNYSLQDNALTILKRELNLEEKDLEILIPINSQGWMINSAFNNQLLWGFYALIKSDVIIDPDFFGSSYSLTGEDIKQLLDELTCLQCRTLLLESIFQGIVATF